MAYEAGSAYISVLPSLKGFQDKITAELKGIKAELIVTLKPELDPAAKQKTKKDGEQAAGAFADAFKARLQAALKSLPKIEITAESAEADRKLAEVRTKLEELGNKRVGIDISESDALAKIAALQAELTEIGKSDPRISVQINTAEALAALDEIHAKIEKTLAPDTEPEGERAAGAWVDGFRTRLEAAIGSLPDIQISASSSEADRAIASVRQKLELLHSQRIGIDIDEADALARIAELQTALEDIGRQHPSVQVRADTAAAAAKLAEIKAEVDALDGKKAEVKADVKVDDKGTTAAVTDGMGMLGKSLLALAPAAVPISASVIPAIAGIGVAGIAAAAGLGVLKLGLSGISDAMSAMDDAQSSATVNAAKNAQTIKDAERSLQDARVAAADSAISAAERVGNAQQALNDAERTSVEQVQQALQRQQQAEQSLADAQRAALRAQMDLNNARQDATRNLEDLQLASRQADIDQRSSILALAQAQQALASVRSNPFAAPGQLMSAQLGLQSAQLAADRAQLQKGRSSQDLGVAQTKGVEGSPQVTGAQEALLRANQGVGNAQQQAGNAAQALADAQITSAEKVANAQQAVADAYRQQATAARQGAESIQRAQEALAQAENSNADAVNKVALAMSKLTPAGQEFVQFLQGLKPLLKTVTDVAQTALLPGLQAGIQALMPALPAIRDLVAQIAGGIGELAKSLGQALGGPFWQDFFHTIGQQIVPALKVMGQILGNFAEGGARIFVALLPLANAFGQAILVLSQRFLAFSQSPALAKFLDYLQQAMPLVGDLMGALGDAVLGLLVPLAKVGLELLKVFVPVIEKLLPPLVRVVAVIGDALVKVLVTAAPGLLKLADEIGTFVGLIVDNFGPVLIQLGGYLGDLALVLADALTSSLKAVEPLLKPMADMLSALLSAVGPLIPMLLRLVVDALKPFLGLLPLLAPLMETWATSFRQIAPPLLEVIKTLAEAFLPLIQDLVPIIKPLLQSLVTIFDAVMRDEIVPLLLYVVIPAMQAVAEILKWLVEKVVAPMMILYGAYSQAAYDNVIKPIFDAMNRGADLMGRSFQLAVDWIGKAWSDLGKLVGTPVKFVIDTVFNEGIGLMINRVADLVGAPRISPVDTSGIPHFAGGGILGGYAPGLDVLPALLSPGEAVLVPEAVQALGASNILALNASLSGRPATVLGGMPRFAGGGVVSDVLGLTGGLGDASKWILDPVTAIKEVLGKSGWVDILAHLPLAPIKQVTDFLWGKISSLGGLLGGNGGGKGGAAGVAAGAGQLDQWIATAMAFAGVPATWAGPLHTLIMRESGGNPQAINLTDSNALAGHPSQGLMQTIPGTFAAYRDQRLSASITDPIANIVAGIHYIQARYGSIFSVQQAVGATPQGYAGGGVVPYLFDQGGVLPPGYSTVLNATRRPEAVFNADQLQTLAGGLPADGWHISGDLTVDGMDAHIDGRIQNSNRATGTAIAQRSRL